MSTPSSTVALADLTLGKELGKGGQGTVRRVQSVRGRTALPSPTVYKEYLPAVLGLLSEPTLRSMTELPGFSATDAAWLRRQTAWPEALVTDRGKVTGFLMRQVPAEFEFDYQGLSPTGSERKLANLEFLLNDDDYVARIGLRVSPRDRLMLLLHLAGTLQRLHGLGIAVGDLSPKNVLFTVEAGPRCLLIDCDAMRFRGGSALPQMETPDWQVPAGEEKATAHSDALKFGLLAIRLMAGEQNAADPNALASAGTALVRLARRSQDPTPSRRPTPSDWILPLERAAKDASTEPARARPAAPGATPVPPVAVPTVVVPPVVHPPVPTPAATPQPVFVLPPTPSVGPARRVGRAMAWVFLGIVVLVGLSLKDLANSPQDSAAPGGAVRTNPVIAPVQPQVPPYQDPIPPPVDRNRPTLPDPPPLHLPTLPPLPSPSPPPPDPIETAEAGNCFTADSMEPKSITLTPAKCGDGTFGVLEVLHRTTDTTRCQNGWSGLSYSKYNLVLCLTYMHPYGSAYHAGVNDCVYGQPGKRWEARACEPGVFTVLSRVTGVAGPDACNSTPRWQRSQDFPVDNWRERNVRLCLEMVYPDAMGRAEVDQCLYKSGSGTQTTFAAVPCDRANVVVVGRTPGYYPNFCGNYAWSSWQLPDYPDLGYTVCYRNL